MAQETQLWNLLSLHLELGHEDLQQHTCRTMIDALKMPAKSVTFTEIAVADADAGLEAEAEGEIVV